MEIPTCHASNIEIIDNIASYLYIYSINILAYERDFRAFFFVGGSG